MDVIERYDLEYFREFLENPSAYPIGRFYSMLRAWGRYLSEHKDKFNYLEDEEWREIRERLIAEYPHREELKAQIDEEWEEINEIEEDADNLTDEELIEYFQKQLEFMKKYQELYDFTDEQIESGIEKLNNYIKTIENQKIADRNYRISKENLAKSIVDLDEELVKVYERTGKIPQLHNYRGIKHHKGN